MAAPDRSTVFVLFKNNYHVGGLVGGQQMHIVKRLQVPEAVVIVVLHGSKRAGNWPHAEGRHLYPQASLGSSSRNGARRRPPPPETRQGTREKEKEKGHSSEPRAAADVARRELLSLADPFIQGSGTGGAAAEPSGLISSPSETSASASASAQVAVLTRPFSSAILEGQPDIGRAKGYSEVSITRVFAACPLSFHATLYFL